MSFLRPKIKDPGTAAPPPVVASATDTMGSLARMRRLRGGRNSFSSSEASSAATSGETRPNTVTGVNG